MTTEDHRIADAEEDERPLPGMMPGLAELLEHLPPLKIGPPMAVFGEGLEAVEQLPDNTLGCVAIVKCEGTEQTPCGQLMRMNLLTDRTKVCKKCGRRFSHLLLIAEEDDDEIVADAMLEVLAGNGYPVPDDDDEEEGEG